MDMMDTIDEGKVNAIVCLHLDRFSRDIHDILKYFRKLEQGSVYMAFADEHFDFSTPEGKMHFHFLAVFADWYIKNLSRETKRGKKNVVDHGYQNNQVPFGYERNPDRKIAQLVPREAEVIKEAFELYALGTYTDADIAKWINDQGFTTRKNKDWTKDSVRTCAGYLAHPPGKRGLSWYFTLIIIREQHDGQNPSPVTRARQTLDKTCDFSLDRRPFRSDTQPNRSGYRKCIVAPAIDRVKSPD